MTDKLVANLNLGVRQEICDLLDIEQSIARNDARLFAQKIGMTQDQINVAWSGRGAGGTKPTDTILTWWKTFNPTVERLKQLMLEMKRYDVVDILEKSSTNIIEEGSIVNWYPCDFYYHPRESIDSEICKIEKGRLLIIHGPVGTGKYSCAVNFLENNDINFSVQWCIDCSAVKDIIESELTINLAEKLQIKSGNSLDDLFQAIKIKAENVEMIFLLQNLDTNQPKWLKELFRIKTSVYIMATSCNNNLNATFQGAQMVDASNFHEGVEFLKENEQVKTNNSDEDLEELCEYYGWNSLGITSAKQYIGLKNMSVKVYLKLMSNKNKALKSRLRKAAEQRIYMSVRSVLEEMEQTEWFKVIAPISLIGHDNIPEFLLRDFFSSPTTVENLLDLNDLITESPFIKLLKPIKNHNDIRLISCQKFTQTVIAELVDEDKELRNDLILRMAIVLMKYFNKDNRYDSGSFFQDILFPHAEIFLKHFETFQHSIKDERILIAVARLSDIVSFSYTQQQRPLSETLLRKHSQRAENIINEMCKIVDPDDFQIESEQKPDDFTEVAQNLFNKLEKKSSKLEQSVVEELVLSRYIDKNDVDQFPNEVRSDLREGITLTEPVSAELLQKLVNNNAAYSVEKYVHLFLPELYVSILYSFGRHYFYLNKQSIADKQFYITRLKIAFCIAKEIGKNMRDGEAIIHEYLCESNGLLYLFVNQEDATSKELKMKEMTVYCNDLIHAIDRYKDLSVTKKTFFELGIFKKNESDVYSWCACQRQIISCYVKLISLSSGEERKLYIDAGQEQCKQLLDRLTDASSSRHLSKCYSIIGDFYLSTDDDRLLLRAWRVFCISAHEAIEKKIAGLVYVKAVIGMSMVLSRLAAKNIIAAKLSIHMLRLVCKSSTNLDEDAELAKNILKIEDQNSSSFVKHTFHIWRRKVLQPRNCREIDQKNKDMTINSSSCQLSEATPTADLETSRDLKKIDKTFSFPKERMMLLAEKIPRDWKIVARYLGSISEDKIDAIRMNYQQDVVEQAYQMLLASWKVCNSKDLWFSHVAAALRESNRNDLAREMES